MQHTYFYKIEAKDHYDLGIKRGELFGNVARTTLQKRKQETSWLKKVLLSKESLTVTDQYFPKLIEELKGYAKASNIDFAEFWTMSLEDDLDYLDSNKCTTVVTNNGMLISHNEDWDEQAEDAICILQKTLHGITTLELFYYNTLGGASCCINSYGYVMTINTLAHTDRQIGVPRNVIARWLSETKNIEEDFEKLKTIPRSLGYNHIFANTKSNVWDLECSAKNQILTRPSLPYVHTNHFLEEDMKPFEQNDNTSGTFERYNQACRLVKPHMSMEEIISLNSSTSNKKESIMNPRTIGKMVVDLENHVAKVWLKREKDKNWVDYKLDFIQ